MTVPKRKYRLAARAEARDDRRRRILEAAYEVFGARRYDDVTLAEVAARAGTSERTVYRLFGTKKRLLSSWLKEIAPGIGPPPDPTVRNDSGSFVRIMVDFYERRGQAILNMLAQEDSVPALRPLLDWGRERYDLGIERGLGHLLHGQRGAARKRRHMQLVVICDVYTWSLLRQGRGLTQNEVVGVLEDMLNALEASSARARAPARSAAPPVLTPDPPRPRALAHRKGGKGASASSANGATPAPRPRAQPTR